MKDQQHKLLEITKRNPQLCGIAMSGAGCAGGSRWLIAGRKSRVEKDGGRKSEEGGGGRNQEGADRGREQGGGWKVVGGMRRRVGDVGRRKEE